MSSILKTNAESDIHLRVISQFDESQYCFSGGKRFNYIGKISTKAFFLQNSFPLLHVDTGHNFPETIEFRDRLVKN
jgi:sulfate adenylyltransferase subunit 2